MWIYLVCVWERDVKFNVSIIQSSFTCKAEHPCWVCRDPSCHIPTQGPPCTFPCRQRLSCSCQLRGAQAHVHVHCGTVELRSPTVKPQAGELVPDLALWGMKSVKHNFPMHLLISKHFAWIIAQISLGSRISGTDKEISFVRSTKCCLHSSTEKVFRKFCSILCCLAQRRASKPGAQNVNIGVI